MAALLGSVTVMSDAAHTARSLRLTCNSSLWSDWVAAMSLGLCADPCPVIDGALVSALTNASDSLALMRPYP